VACDGEDITLWSSVGVVGRDLLVGSLPKAFLLDFEVPELDGAVIGDGDCHAQAVDKLDASNAVQVAVQLEFLSQRRLHQLGHPHLRLGRRLSRLGGIFLPLLLNRLFLINRYLV
jgi:hypothetical protein